MSMTTLLYGLIIFTCDQVLVRGSAMSSASRDDAAPLLLYNPSVHDLEPFEYSVKRESDRPRESSSDSAGERSRRKEHPGTSYIRIGRSQEQQVNGYNIEAAGDRSTRGRSDNIIRFGRSSLKLPHHKIDQLSRGFVRIAKSGSSEFARLGRSAVNSVGLPSEAEMAILCPNILVEEDSRGSEDLQLYLAKLMYICNNNNNNNNNGDRSDDNPHRNNLEFVEVNGDTV